MGTHPKGPSKLSDTAVPLSDLLSKNPTLLGEKVINHWPKTQGLPFLFKVLSINKGIHSLFVY